MPTVDFEAYLSEDVVGDHVFGVADLLRMEDEANIDVAVVMPANRSAAGENYLQPNNQRVADLIRGNRRCVGCATINPTLGEENTRHQLGIMLDNGFGGAKLMAVLHHYNIDDSAVDPVMQALDDHKLVASIHSGGGSVHPNRIEKVARRFPNVPIIMDHMGYPDATSDAIRVAEACPNVYLGTTILRFFKPPDQAVPTAVAEAVKRVGPERVVWGSNLPEYPHSALWCRQAIERLKLGAEAEALIFGEVLTRLYKIDWI